MPRSFRRIRRESYAPFRGASFAPVNKGRVPLPAHLMGLDDRSQALIPVIRDAPGNWPEVRTAAGTYLAGYRPENKWFHAVYILGRLTLSGDVLELRKYESEQDLRAALAMLRDGKPEDEVVAHEYTA